MSVSKSLVAAFLSSVALFVGASDAMAVVVGTIDLSAPQRVAELKFATPYQDGSEHWILYRYGKLPCPYPPNPPPISYKAFKPTWYSFGDPAGYGGPCLNGKTVPNEGGKVVVPDGASVDVEFLIPTWIEAVPPYPPKGESVEVRLGTQTQTATFGTPSLVFQGVVAGTHPITLVVHGGSYVGNTPQDTTIPGILPLQILLK